MLHSSRLASCLAPFLVVVLGACATVDHTRAVVDSLRIHGTHAVSADDVRQRLVTREVPRFPIVPIRSPFEAPVYYDPMAFQRDLQRIVRFYASRGYYSAEVTHWNVANVHQRHDAVIDVTVREGPPVRVTSVWLSGCDPGSVRSDEVWRVPPRACERMRRQIQLRNGSIFTEEAYHADQALLLALMKDEGRAIARVEPSAVVDADHHEAHLVYVLVPGPPARFGTVTIVEGAHERTANAHGVLPSGYPIRPALDVIDTKPGQPYSNTVLADAQHQLFQLGMFGIVRIDQLPHECDSHDRCDAAHDPTDPHGYVRVDLRVHVTPARHFRIRTGFGIEADQLRSDVHLFGSAEDRNFLGGGRRLRIEERPLVFFPSVFGGAGEESFDLGNALSLELQQPAVWHHGTLIASAQWEFGPDPFNPGLTDRNRVSLAVGAQQRFNRELHGAAYIRATRIDYYQSFVNGQGNQLIDIDPIYRSQYEPASQMYAYLEQQLTWDRRDSTVATRRGTYFAASAQEGAPVFGEYAFLRGTLEGRGFVPLGAGFVLAARGFVGAAVGLGSDVNGWPVPQELRFYSGGANSNRGYPFNRVGPIVTAPGLNCTYPGVGTIPYYDRRCRTAAATTPYSLYVNGYNATPDLRRVVSVGGLTLWEASLELRWYHGPLGLVLFLDASDVGGWTAPQYNAANASDPVNDPLRRPNPITDVAATSQITPTLPGAQAFLLGMDPHPSVGIGARYLTPVGIIRVDVGVRVDDLTCSRFNTDVANVNAATRGQPWYYASSRPPCDTFNLPIGINLALGEAY